MVEVLRTPITNLQSATSRLVEHNKLLPRDTHRDPFFATMPNTYAIHGFQSLGADVPAEGRIPHPKQLPLRQGYAEGVWNRKIPNDYQYRMPKTWFKTKELWPKNPLSYVDQYKPVPVASQRQMMEEHNPKPHPLRSKVPCIPKADIVNQYGIKNITGGQSQNVFNIGVAPSIEDAMEEKFQANLKMASFNSHLSEKAVQQRYKRAQSQMMLLSKETSNFNIERFRNMRSPDNPGDISELTCDTSKDYGSREHMGAKQLQEVIRQRNRSTATIKRGEFYPHIPTKVSSLNAAAEKYIHEQTVSAKADALNPRNAVEYDRATQEVKIGGEMLQNSIYTSNQQTRIPHAAQLDANEATGVKLHEG